MKTSYQVMRPFQGYSIGDVIPEEQFSTTRRAQQLTEQRFIQPIVVAAEGYQPSVESLLGTAIRPLRIMIADVRDAAVLHAARLQETREIALQIFDRRIEELEAQRG
jgi:hypothetical protein